MVFTESIWLGFGGVRTIYLKTVGVREPESTEFTRNLIPESAPIRGVRAVSVLNSASNISAMALTRSIFS